LPRPYAARTGPEDFSEQIELVLSECPGCAPDYCAWLSGIRDEPGSQLPHLSWRQSLVSFSSAMLRHLTWEPSIPTPSLINPFILGDGPLGPCDFPTHFQSPSAPAIWDCCSIQIVIFCSCVAKKPPVNSGLRRGMKVVRYERENYLSYKPPNRQLIDPPLLEY